MQIDLNSLQYNSSLKEGVGTPSWGTSLGQSKPYYFLTREGIKEISIGMINNFSEEISCNFRGDKVVIISARFEKVFIHYDDTTNKMDNSLMLAIVYEKNDSHYGRKNLKYNHDFKIIKGENEITNETLYHEISNYLGGENTCWFAYDIIYNETDNSIHMYIIKVSDEEKVYENAKERKDEWQFLLSQKNIKIDINYESLIKENALNSNNNNSGETNKIYFGAPGTSKSYTINELTQGEKVIRTTFHPDSDYSTFVGAYKPTTIEVKLRDVSGHIVKEDGKPVTEERIIYEFVQQAFLQAYTNAWKMWKENKKQYLVIEEINRGNCAQIFGDLFQLLDRNESGYSDYPIISDKDMQKQLRKSFADIELNEDQSTEINSKYKNKDIASKVLNGEVLLLPNNLYIWATMNTSDQSLFPIDSAFKRRWDWKYMPISNACKNWTIEVNGSHYDWWDFLTKINNKIGNTTSSEDKKLGYFFCKGNTEGIISAERFVGKVLFYLWNDVFKDYEFSDEIFNDTKVNEDMFSKLSFDKFYTSEGIDTKVAEEKVELFLNNLKLNKIVKESESFPLEEKVRGTIKVNGQKVEKLNAIPFTAIKTYVEINQDKSADEVLSVWSPFKKYTTKSWIVANKEEKDKMDPTYGNYVYEIICSDGQKIYVNKDGWMHNPNNGSQDTIKEFIEAVNEANLGIFIEELPL